MSFERKKLPTMKAFFVAMSRGKNYFHLFTKDSKKLCETIDRFSGSKTTAIEAVEQTKRGKTKREKTEGKGLEQDKERRQREEIIKETKEGKKTEKPCKEWDIKLIHEKLADRTEEIARKFLGEPKKKNAQEWRYGKNKGSLVLTTAGDKRGFWYDFQTGEGGNLLKLIQRETSGDFKEILDYAASFVGLSEQVAIAHRTFRNTGLECSNGTKSQKREEKQHTLLNYTEEQKKRIAYAQKLEKESKGIKGTLAERYLKEHRGIKRSLPSSLRFHPKIWDSSTKQNHPALLAIAKDKEGITRAVQAIFLDTKTANKAQIEIKKRTYGVLKGVSVNLYSFPENKDLSENASNLSRELNLNFDQELIQEAEIPAGQSSIVAISEGIETALSIKEARPDIKVHAVLGASNFTNFQVGKNKHLLICADNDGKDSSTLKMIDRTANNLLDKGIKFDVIMPQKEGQDFNDLLKNGGVKAVEDEIKKGSFFNQNKHNFNSNILALKIKNNDYFKDFIEAGRTVDLVKNKELSHNIKPVNLEKSVVPKEIDLEIQR
jgi:hypothetical protein